MAMNLVLMPPNHTYSGHGCRPEVSAEILTVLHYAKQASGNRRYAAEARR